MPAQAIPPVVMAGIAFYVASSFLVSSFRRKDRGEYLTFGLSCLAVGVYDLLCAGLYSASSVIEGAGWQRAQFASLALVAIPFIWFVASHTRQGDRRMLHALTACYALFAVIQIVDRSDLTLIVNEASIKRVHRPAGLDVTYYEAASGIVTQAQRLVGLLVVVYMLRLAALAYRSGRRKEARPLLLALGLFAGAVLNDIFVSTGIFHFIYLMEYGYLAMIGLISHALSRPVVEAAPAKEALRRTEERFRSLVETSGDWVWETDRRGAYTYASPTVRALLGYEPEEIVGRTPFDFMPPDEAERVRSLFQEIAAAGRPLERLENVNRHKDGRLVVLETIAVPFFDASGALLGYRGIDRDVTARKQAETAVQESEARFRSLVENAPAGIVIVNDAYRFLYVNDELCRMVGRSRAEVIGHDFRELLDEESRSLVGDHYLRRRKGEDVPVRYEFNIVRKDGERRRAEIRAAVIRDSRGERQTIGQLLDVTERRRAEDALKDKTAELERYFTSALDLLCIADTDGYFRRLNPAWETTLGYSIGELKGRRFLDFVHPDDLEPTRLALGRLGEQKEVLGFVNRYRARDGSYRWIEWRSFPSGTVIYATARDITERKRAETALEESRRMLRLILDTIPVRVFWKDTEGRYLGCNRPFASDAGLGAPEELLGKTDHDMAWTEQAELYRADDRQVGASGVPKVGYEEPQTTPSGARLCLRTSKVPLRDGEGRIVGVLGTYEDITESKRLDEERANLQAQLYQAQKMESVGRLAGGVAHDFNNLLHVIMGFVELLRRQMPADIRLANYLDEIERAAGRAQDVTHQLLAFSRRQVISPVPSDLNRLVTRLSGGLSRLIGEDIALRVESTEGLWLVNVDPTQVDQVLLNLAVNARDAMPSGGKVTIETANVRLDESYRRQHATARPGDYVLLAFSDTGIGMDRETLSHAFEPFFTTKEMGKGTGLGLATVHGIVEQNGGFVNVYSEPGQGTTFKIYLPRAVEAGAPDAEIAEPLDYVGAGTVLVAEDEELVRRITVALVQSLGYEVVAACSGDEAIELCKAGAPRIDVVLTDVVMPGTSGRELRQRLEEFRPGIKILFTSGYTANVIAHHGILDKGVHFIAKPFGITDLAKALRGLLAADRKKDA
jgi:two-component system, cell cycle sensor histidine kinase and response regulator CckA